MSMPNFKRKHIGTLNNHPLGNMNTLLTVGDINGDGLVDIVVGGRSGLVAWFQNPGVSDGEWLRHDIGPVTHIECGGITYDLTGSGLPDVITGGDWQSDELSWWENPGSTGTHWQRHIIARTGYGQFHDVRIGDVYGTGEPALVFWNNHSATLYAVPIPADPRVSPWPDIETIAADQRVSRFSEEGLELVDIDNDGQLEIIAGTHWYKYDQHHEGWARYRFAENYISTVIAVADIDKDGELEILLGEGDAYLYERRKGRVGWFKRGGDVRALWQEHLLGDDFYEPHSLQAGDVTGNGYPDILAGEIGVSQFLESDPPRLIIYENHGDGRFTPYTIDTGTGCHHTRLLDLTNNGKLDIVSRPLLGADRWHIYAWYNEG